MGGVSVAELLQWGAPYVLVLLHLHLVFTEGLASDEVSTLDTYLKWLLWNVLLVVRFMIMWSFSPGRVW